MKTNKSQETKSSLVRTLGDYLTAALVIGAWTSYGPRGWQMDEPTLRMFLSLRDEARPARVVELGGESGCCECAASTALCCAG